MRSDFTRRGFMKAAGLGLAAAVLPSTAVGAGTVRTGQIVPKGEKIRIACVGVGGKGSGDVRGVSGEDIVALCDVDLRKAHGTFKQYPNVPKYKDYRKMLIEMDDRIDAVTVSTPDHMHFPIAMMAMSMGKHVFVQKPMAHTVWEARQMAIASRKHKVMTQMGNQGHTNEGTRLVREWIEQGAVGDVTEVHLVTNRPVWPQGIDRPSEVQTPPDNFDWNLWLGVAPERPYNSCYAPFKWRGWWDFGCGALGDMGAHIMDASWWGLQLGYPDSVEAEVPDHHPETPPKWSIVTYNFPARGKMPPVKLKWYDGKKMPSELKHLEPERKLNNDPGGQFLVGTKASIMGDCYCRSVRLVPETRMQEVGKPERTLPRSNGGVFGEWLNAIHGDGVPGSNFVDHAGPLCEVMLTANLALRTGKKIEFDYAKLECTNVPEANEYVRHPYRIF